MCVICRAQYCRQFVLLLIAIATHTFPYYDEMQIRAMIYTILTIKSVFAQKGGHSRHHGKRTLGMAFANFAGNITAHIFTPPTRGHHSCMVNNTDTRNRKSAIKGLAQHPRCQLITNLLITAPAWRQVERCENAGMSVSCKRDVQNNTKPHGVVLHISRTARVFPPYS